MKLPEIQYRRVSGARGIGPEAALQGFQQTQQIKDAVFGVTRQFAEESARYEATTALSQFRDGLSHFENEVATMRVATPDQVEEWGLDDRVPTTTADGRRREYIPKHEWYTFLKERAIDDLKRTKGGDISSPKVREAWMAEVGNIERHEIEQSIAHSAKLAHEFQRERVVADFNAALVAGNWQTARDKLADQVFADNPELKTRLMDEVNQSEEVARINRLARDGSPAQLRAEAERMGSDDYLAASPLNDQQRHQKIGELSRMAKAHEAEARALQKEQQDRYRANWWQNYLVKANTEGLNASDLAGLNELEFMSVADIKAAWAMFDNAAETGSFYAKETDPGVYMRLHDTLASGDAMEFRRELQQAIPNLRQSDYIALVKQGEQLAQQPEYGQGISTDAQIVSDALGVLGVDTTKTSDNRDLAAQQKAMFRRQYDYEVQRQELEKKRQLDSTEKRKIADQLTVTMRTREPVRFLGFQIRGAKHADVYDAIYQDLGEDLLKYETTMRQITEALEATGLPATQEEIMRLYRSGSSAPEPRKIW
jgi:hypothetical protein